MEISVLFIDCINQLVSKNVFFIFIRNFLKKKLLILKQEFTSEILNFVKLFFKKLGILNNFFSYFFPISQHTQLPDFGDKKYTSLDPVSEHSVISNP